MNSTIAVLPGDGIGPEVTAEAIKVLDAVASRFGHDFDLRYGRIGGNAIDDFGTPLPDETLEVCDGVDGVLFGAVGGPKWDDPNAETRPEDGILAIRKGLDLFANLRPVKVFPAIINSSPIKPHLLKGVDIMVVRELTSGLYFGKPKKRWDTSRGRRAVDTLKYTEKEIERILRVGFELARGRRGKLTSTDKANVMATSRLWREMATEMAAEYPDVELEHMYADNLAMQIIRAPAQFDVIVGENTFGDIISDEARGPSRLAGHAPFCQPRLLARKRRQAQACGLPLRAHTRQRTGHRRAGDRQPHRYGPQHVDDAALLPGDGRGGRRGRASGRRRPGGRLPHPRHRRGRRRRGGHHPNG